MNANTKKFIEERLNEIVNTPYSQLSNNQRQLKEFYAVYSNHITELQEDDNNLISKRTDVNGNVFVCEGYNLEDK